MEPWKVGIVGPGAYGSAPIIGSPNADFCVWEPFHYSTIPVPQLFPFHYSSTQGVMS